MKEIKVEETISHVEYMANDGTQFKDKQECRKYEESAQGVLLAKYMDYVVKQTTEDGIYDCGSEDYYIDVVHVRDMNAVTIISQLFILFNPQYNCGDRLEYLSKLHKKLDKALDDNDYVFIGRGYQNDEFWITKTASEAIEGIKEACTPNEK